MAVCNMGKRSFAFCEIINMLKLELDEKNKGEE